MTRPPFPIRDSDRSSNESIVILSDLPPSTERMLNAELLELRGQISRLLGLPASDTPIKVRLFGTRVEYDQFMQERFPAFPNRRAFFVKESERLSVYAFRSERGNEDLRHEITHGTLHAVAPQIPLWLDEGLAEYFEVDPQLQGTNQRHADLLTRLSQQRAWRPNLERLEAITSPTQLTQTDYAESWLWVHFLLQTSPARRSLIRELLNTVRTVEVVPALVPIITQNEPDLHGEINRHLQSLSSR